LQASRPQKCSAAAGTVSIPNGGRALLLYGYARRVRSARKIERGCEEDVAFKTIGMM